VIYNIATVAEARGDGGATEMVQFLKEEVYKRGYQQVSLFAMPEGRGIYQKRGFRSNAASYAVYTKIIS
jgi:ribosomal protein S18 acetylase RimI-like enzyme